MTALADRAGSLHPLADQRRSTRFTATSTASEVVEGLDLRGRRAVVTGGASGIGLETARALALAGASVTLAVRDEYAGMRAAADIVESTGNTDILVARVDLAELDSVAAFVRTWDGPLHMLVANASAVPGPLLRTSRGHELQFAVNHLGHFKLATGLWPALAAAGDARIVTLSSSAHLRAPVDLDDLQFTRRPYHPGAAYAQSKTAAVLFAVEATRRWAGDGITANAVMPGGVRTAHRRDPHGTADYDGAVRWKTAAQGAATPVLVATAPELTGIGGRYFEDCAIAEENVPGSRTGYARHAVDPETAQRLWDASADLVR
ncbi:SDR family NAD(P)-dependent oxidoreductase [Pseudonocardia thermophila]|jgi:Dehydrogenases with different specificities (related to short-chain alcohol dehydrogenases)|uniref:SDR family NAD(P)-dependent oxidoreductase n=1 Tax=Pseudonocardia thermophila TaxID=1848 RepID=UPI00248E2AD7|nr:SDR family NAD(P)-dependent oxidoreductase [Pseudonocardia thermophila]